MIQLQYEKYCEICPYFDPEAYRNEIYCDHKLAGCFTTIFCKDRDRCAAIYARIKEEEENEEK